MSARSLKSYLWLAVLLVVAGLKLYQEFQTPPAATPPSHSTSPPPHTNGWATLTGATVFEDRNNDGDSFKLSHEGQVHEFRLYFVDAPEKRRHQYNGERLHHQGAYFGGLNEAQTIALGLAAKDFTRHLLSSQPFQVLTRWQRVYDSDRCYAMIQFEGGEFLAEKLTHAGLARIYTEGTALPDGTREHTFEQRLKKLEQAAKTAGRGGWAR